MAPARSWGALSLIFIVVGILALASCFSALSRQAPSTFGREHADPMPLTVRLQDVDNQEKVGYLPKPPLSADGMPEGDDPQPGDVEYSCFLLW